jgi:hypothetical protein
MYLEHFHYPIGASGNALFKFNNNNNNNNNNNTNNNNNGLNGYGRGSTFVRG